MTLWQNISSATLSANYGFVNVLFSADVAFNSTRFLCSQLFIPETIALLGNGAVYCLWSSARNLTITLNVNATVSPRNDSHVIGVLPGVLRACSSGGAPA